MAMEEVILNEGWIIDDDVLNIKSLLSSAERDFLVRKNGKQVKVDNLSGKNIGLLLSRPDTFSNSWYPGCVSNRHFIPILVDVYNELSPQGNFEIIFVSAETDKYSFIGHFSKMPWLAIPFSDLERRRLVNRFSQKWWSGGFPYLLIFDGNGKIIRKNGVEIIRNYGVEGYPFTEERITLLKEQEEASKKAESLSSILVSPSRDFLISNDGKKVPISELEGKTVALYFSFFTNGLCMEFTPILVEVYEKLKKRGENFEVVLVSLDEDEEKYKEDFQKMPCLSLPFNDKRCNKMVRYFQVRKLPMLVIVGPDGKTLNPNVVELVEDHGVQAYPFTPERLEEVEKAKQEAQTLESVLVLGELDFVIDKEGTQIPVSQLVGKNILLYFPDGTGNDSYGILPKMINVYHEIKAKDDAFEVIFISDENYYYLFEEFFSEMPWLAFPCGDERSEFLRRSFRISLISTVIAIGPTGKTITKNAREPLLVHGADAYPFTEERLKEIEAKLEETVEGWPEKVKHVHFTKTKMGMHVRCKEEHELVLARRPLYDCYVCWEAGSGWSYHCEECGNFILHPKCVLVEDKEDKDGVEDGKRSSPVRPVVQSRSNGLESQNTHPNVLVDVPFDSNPSIRGWTNWMDWRQSKSVEDDGIDQASKEYGYDVNSCMFKNIKSFLLSAGRDFLVRNNGEQVKIDNLSGKNIGLYFSAPRPGSCQHFLPVLVDVYNELSPQGNFEIIFVSEEKDENAFKEYFSKMPWLAIPFSDSERREQVCNALGINVMPCLLIIDGNGAVVTRYGYHEIFLFGVEGYPFTEERLELLVRQEEESKKTQSLSSILVLKSLDFVVSNDGKKVPISELEGKTVALYFFLSSPDPFIEFTSILVEVYEKLKKRGENFDVVLVPLDKDHYEEQYKEAFQKMPWLSLPLHDRRCFKLNQYFKFMSHPMLVIIGPDGKTLNPNVAEVVKNHGVQAYPFTSERLQELAQIDKAKLEAQTLESVMVMGELDFVTSKEGTRILVSQLVGKNILLYFSAAWCGACVASMPKLIKSYHEIKAKDDSFEVIFISWDNDQASFDEFFSEMPWLALPFGDERTKLISHSFEVSCIPTAIVIGPTGKNIIKNARAPLRLPGAGAYPITEERWKEIEAIIEENAKEWLKKVKHVLGDVEHELVLTRIYSSYACRWCGKAGTAWSFHCEDCDFNLHPKCALEKDKEEKDGVEDVDADDGIDQAFEEGRTNDGEVCHKA